FLDNATGSMSVEYGTVDLRTILENQEAGPSLSPGDILIVRTLADRRVHITLRGAFRTTGAFTLPAGSKVSDAIRLAGGVLPEAFPRGMRLFRKSEAEVAQQFLNDMIRRVEASIAVNRRAALEADEEARADAERDLARQEALLLQMRRASATGRMAGIDFPRILEGDANADIVLQDGDVLELPERPGAIRILGEVMTPGSIAFLPGLSVKELIRRSGGYTRQADKDAVFVVRADGSVVATAQGDTLAWDAERRSWTRATLSSIKLEEGDTVIIPADLRYRDSQRRIIRDWTQIMFQVAATIGTIAVIAK
ncbi:MAG: capsule biosynthesis GfcC family protein, partial [Rectinema sp.]|nr:capsule biosynthesis GfcC family protein [Rectinema sp.]